MNLQDYLNVQRVFKLLAAEWKCPVWLVKITIRRMIKQSWDRAMSNPEEKALLDRYFPKGKPTPSQYICRLGHAHETGEEIPFFFKEQVQQELRSS